MIHCLYRMSTYAAKRLVVQLTSWYLKILNQVTLRADYIPNFNLRGGLEFFLRLPDKFYRELKFKMVGKVNRKSKWRHECHLWKWEHCFSRIQSFHSPQFPLNFLGWSQPTRSDGTQAKPFSPTYLSIPQKALRAEEQQSPASWSCSSKGRGLGDKFEIITPFHCLVTPFFIILLWE